MRNIAIAVLAGIVPLTLVAAPAPEAASATNDAIVETGQVAIRTAPLVEPSFRNEQLRICFFADNKTDKPLELTLKPVLLDFATTNVALMPPAQKVVLPPMSTGEASFVVSAKGLKTWSHWTPNLYFLDLSIEQGGKEIGKMPRVRFGYREVWVDKGRFYINGKRLFLPGGNHGGRRNETEIKFAREANFTADTIRDDLTEASEARRAADLADRWGHYNVFFGNPVGTRRDLYQYGVWANHPSIIAYAGGTAGYYSGPHGHPMQIGGIITDEMKAQATEDEKKEAFEYPKAHKILDPTRPYGHYVRGVGGEFRSLMWDLGWGVPAQSQEEWVSVYARNLEQIEPFFPQEFGLMRLGANMVRIDRRFGQSCLTEHATRYFGERSYEMFTTNMVETYAQGVVYPQNEMAFCKLYSAQKEHIYGRVVPAWRVQGCGGMLLHVDGHPGNMNKGTNATDLCRIFHKVFAPEYFILAGPAEDFVAKDHLFYEGEKIRKTGIVINDTADDMPAKVSWAIADAGGKEIAKGGGNLDVKQGLSAKMAIELDAPKAKAKTELTIKAEAQDGAGALIRADEMKLRVFPKSEWAWKGGEVLLVDGNGRTRSLFEKMGVKVRALACDSNAATANAAALKGAKLLVVGRNSYPALVQAVPADALKDAIHSGLNVVVLEQLNRHVMGVKAEYTGTRDVFVRDGGDALLKGLDNEDFRDWRGESDMFASYPNFCTNSLWWAQGYSYQGQFNKWRQRRAWLWSNKAMVASLCLEKPQFGNFRVLLDAWFDLLGTPLIEFQQGKGRILLNTLDLVDHYGADPVATMMLQRMLDEYVKPGARTFEPVGFLGARAGAALKDLRMEVQQGMKGKVILLLPEDLDAMSAAQSGELKGFVEKGGAALCLVNSAEQAGKLPVKLTLEPRKLFNPDLPDDPAFEGLGMSEVFLRETQEYQAVVKAEGGAAKIAKSGIAAAIQCGKGRVVVLQVPPEKFKGATEDVFWSRSKVLRLYAAVLSNLGGKSAAELDPAAIGGWGIREEWMPGFADEVPKKGPVVRESSVYEMPALDWDPDWHVSF